MYIHKTKCAQKQHVRLSVLPATTVWPTARRRAGQTEKPKPPLRPCGFDPSWWSRWPLAVQTESTFRPLFFFLKKTLGGRKKGRERGRRRREAINEKMTEAHRPKMSNSSILLLLLLHHHHHPSSFIHSFPSYRWRWRRRRTGLQ